MACYPHEAGKCHFHRFCHCLWARSAVPVTKGSMGTALGHHNYLAGVTAFATLAIWLSTHSNLSQLPLLRYNCEGSLSSACKMQHKKHAMKWYWCTGLGGDPTRHRSLVDILSPKPVYCQFPCHLTVYRPPNVLSRLNLLYADYTKGWEVQFNFVNRNL